MTILLRIIVNCMQQAPDASTGGLDSLSRAVVITLEFEGGVHGTVL